MKDPFRREKTGPTVSRGTGFSSPQSLQEEQGREFAQKLGARAPEHSPEGPVHATELTPYKTSKGDEKLTLAVRVVNGIITAALALLFFGVPLFFLDKTLQGIAFEKQIYFSIVLFVALGAWVLKSIFSGKIELAKTPVDIPIALFWVIFVVATVISPDRFHSTWGFFGDPTRGLFAVTAMIVAFYLVVTHTNLQRTIIFLSATLLSGFLAIVWALLGVMGVLPESFIASGAVTITGSAHGLATFAAITLFLAVGAQLVVTEAKDNIMGQLWFRIFLGVVIALALFLLLALHTFVPWWGVIAAAAIYTLYVLAKIVKPQGAWVLLPLGIFALVILFFMVGGNNSIARVAPQAEILPQPALAWDVAKETLKNEPLFGVGPALYGNAFSQYHPQSFNEHSLFSLRFFRTHGALFSSLATIGAAGTIALLLVMITFIGTGFYQLSYGAARGKIIPLSIFCAIGATLVGSLFVFVDGATLFVSVLLAGIFVASFMMGEEERFRTLVFSRTPQFALTHVFMLMIVGMIVVASMVVAGRAFTADRLALQAVRGGEVSEENAQLLVRAIGINKKEGRYFTQLAQNYIALANREVLDENRQDVGKIRNYLDDAIQAAEAGVARMPEDALAQETLAQIYDSARVYVPDATQLSRDAYVRLAELEPVNPVPIVKIGQIDLLGVGQTEDEQLQKNILDDARELFNEAIALKDDYPPSHYQLARTLETLEEIDDAVRSAERAFTLDRTRIDYALLLGRLYRTRGGEQDRENAEFLLKSIIDVQEENVNAHLELGLLYEDEERRDEAINEMRAILEILPEDSTEARKRIEGIIDRIEKGNTPQGPEPPIEEEEEPLPEEENADDATDDTSAEESSEDDDDEGDDDDDNDEDDDDN